MVKPNIEEICLEDTDFSFDGLVKKYNGKVRDVYYFKDIVAVVATDRISAFDHILPRPIPFKGQILNQIAFRQIQSTKTLVPNWIIASPHENVTIGHRCSPIKLEMVIRGYLTGHAWRVYKSGKRELCGVKLPNGMREHDPFPSPIITPATKAEEGHDEDISEASILDRGIVSESVWNRLKEYTYRLFGHGSDIAGRQGLILVDTKYEFGLRDGEVTLIDEIHTPDSSRYFISEGYEERQKRGEPQKQLSKEFVREWLMAHNFQGHEMELMPHMPDDFVWHVSERYQELYERLMGEKVDLNFDEDRVRTVQKAIEKWLPANL